MSEINNLEDDPNPPYSLNLQEELIVENIPIISTLNNKKSSIFIDIQGVECNFYSSVLYWKHL